MNDKVGSLLTIGAQAMGVLNAAARAGWLNDHPYAKQQALELNARWEAVCAKDEEKMK